MPPVEIRKVGKTCSGVPSPEEMQKDREAALQAAMDITSGKASWPTELKDNMTLRKTDKKNKENAPSKKTPHSEKIQTFALPGYQQARQWYCENCTMVHGGPLCPCPICQQKGHLYYHCPNRGKKESIEGAYQQMQTPEDGPVCQTCGQKHGPPCTIGLKQQGQIQRQIRHRNDDGKYKEPLDGVHIESKATTPFCIYCGSKGRQHTPKCELWETMGPNEEPLCTFCGIMGHWADNCAECQRAFQEQQQVGHLCTFCGSQEHVYLNCVLYRENLKNQKQDISSQNEEKYRTAAASQRGTAQTQQGKTYTSQEGSSKSSTQASTTVTEPAKRIINVGGGGINLQEGLKILRKNLI